MIISTCMYYIFLFQNPKVRIILFSYHTESNMNVENWYGMLYYPKYPSYIYI